MQSNSTSPSALYDPALQPKGFPGLPDGWVSDWETFPTADGKLNLFSVHHHPLKWDSPRALVVMHGLGEHSGRYLHVAHYLQNTVGSVYCFDHRGHGRSSGLRGHIDRFDDYVDDAALAIRRLDEQLKKRFGSSEIHLLAHSMGGLVALRALFLYPDLPLYSTTVTSPLLGVRVKIPAPKRIAAQVLSRVWGSLHMSNEVDPTLLSHDPEVGLVYVRDRLVHRKGTPRFYTELMAALSDTNLRESGLKVPLQMLVSLQDEIVDSDATLNFFRDLKFREKQLKTYPGFYHEAMNEVGKEQVFEDIRAWILSHHE